jgi:hypothetical protein
MSWHSETGYGVLISTADQLAHSRLADTREAVRNTRQ